MLLLGVAHLGFGQSNVVTFTNRNGKVYQDVVITEVTKDWLTWVPARGIGMGRVRLADLPDDQQRRFGYDAAQGAERDIEAALGAGLFRELDGMVYDLRKPQAEWMLFYGAWLAGQGQDGAFIVPKPSDLAIRDRRMDGIVDAKTHKGVLWDAASNPTDILIYVRHLKPTGEYLNFWAKRSGMYTLSRPMMVGKRIFAGAISMYDAGRACEKDDVPEVVLNGHKSSARSLAIGREGSSSGTGFFITDDGHLVTCEHVVHASARVRVRVGEALYAATVLKTDRNKDLAILRIQADTKPLPLDLTGQPRLGEAVFTIGFPIPGLQGIKPKFTDGKISSLTGIKDNETHFQVSVPVQPGNSGGALVADRGAVIGVINARLNDMNTLSRAGVIPQNVNYAVKATELNSLIRQIPGLSAKVIALRTTNRASKPTSDLDRIATAEAATVMVLAD